MSKSLKMGPCNFNQDHSILLLHGRTTPISYAKSILKLSVAHEKLNTEHEVLSENHERLTSDFEKVGDAVSEFIQSSDSLRKRMVERSVVIVCGEVIEAKGLPAKDAASKSSDPL